MAEQRGHNPFKGRLGKSVGYQLGGKHIVRTIGFDKDAFATDPRYAGTRKANAAFGQLSATGKFFRDTLAPFIKELGRKQLDNPVNQLFSEMRRADPRLPGDYAIGSTLQHPDVVPLFRGFEFNKASGWMRNILCTDLHCDADTLVLTLRNFDPATALRWPKSANYASFSSCAACFDFSEFTGSIVHSNTVFVHTDPTDPYDLLLEPTAEVSRNGVNLVLLKVVFFERLNGIDYPLSGSLNGCMVVYAG